MENPENLIFVIFGASGDLTARKLIPAYLLLRISRLCLKSMLSLGLGRTEMTNEVFRTKIKEAIHSFSEDKIPDRHSCRISQGTFITFRWIVTAEGAFRA